MISGWLYAQMVHLLYGMRMKWNGNEKWEWDSNVYLIKINENEEWRMRNANENQFTKIPIILNNVIRYMHKYYYKNNIN